MISFWISLRVSERIMILLLFSRNGYADELGENRQRDVERSKQRCHQSASGTYSVDVVGWPQRGLSAKGSHTIDHV
jgi:hypothetical protein